MEASHEALPPLPGMEPSQEMLGGSTQAGHGQRGQATGRNGLGRVCGVAGVNGPTATNGQQPQEGKRGAGVPRVWDHKVYSGNINCS